MNNGGSSPHDATQDADRSELETLLALMADDQLTPEQSERLEAQVQVDQAARKQYIEMALLCADLEWTCGAGHRFHVLPQAYDLHEYPSLAVSRSAGITRSIAPFVTGIAAAALLLAALGMLQWPATDELAQLGTAQLESAQQENEQLAESTTSDAVEIRLDSDAADIYQNEAPSIAAAIAATITGMVDCRWDAESAAPAYGEQLKNGRNLKLKSGLAQLTFESGAKLILQGPAEFLVRSDMQGTLGIGKLSAVVPQQAHGFTVQTPSAEIVDLGTEFGIEVDEGNRTEVHVFEGEVLSWQLDSSGDTQGEVISLTKDDGATFSQGVEASQGIQADPSKFVREVSPRLSHEQLPPMPVKRDLALWLAADVLVKKDDQGHVIAWRDILFGDNQMEEDAWQYDPDLRPTWVEEAIGGKPAIRFDGQTSHLVTTPLPTTKDQTLLFVFRRLSDAANLNHMLQLINYNGPPFNLPDPTRPFSILQIDDKGEPGRYRAFIYAGIDESHTIHLGKVQMQEPAAIAEPIVMSYTYNTGENRSELAVNGVSQEVSTASSGVEFVSRKILGKHPLQNNYFHGDVSEVLIFNTGLSREETKQIERYLCEKYSVPFSESN